MGNDNKISHVIDNNTIGHSLYELAKVLFPICRSITGNGVRDSFTILQDFLVQKLTIHEVPTGTQVFDWEVPQEWNIKDAWVKDSNGNKIIDFNNNNLHVVGYSIPVHKKLSKADLEPFLYSLPDQETAIPYVTSYYKERWGFCLTDKQRQQLPEQEYEVFVDSELSEGHLTYGELLIEGESKEEILISTYLCHPSMANNELSGPLVTSAIINWISSLPKRKFSYRFVFVPETIGAITYLSLNLKHLKKNIVAGYVLTCIGDNGDYSMLQSRYGNTSSDKVAECILSQTFPDYKNYSFLKRGSDERQYCSPGIDLPIASLMRTKYGIYSEYHTSLDNLNFISPEGLNGGFELVQRCLSLMEKNVVYQAVNLGEPKLSKYDLYPTISQKGSSNTVRNMLNFLTYCDGSNDLIDISNIINVCILEVIDIAELLLEKSLIKLST